MGVGVEVLEVEEEVEELADEEELGVEVQGQDIPGVRPPPTELLAASTRGSGRY